MLCLASKAKTHQKALKYLASFFTIWRVFQFFQICLISFNSPSISDCLSRVLEKPCLVSSIRLKKEEIFWLFDLYWRFLRTSIVTANPIAIAMISTIPTPMMYVSVGGRAIAGYGDGVGAASSTAKEVTACDGQ
jgi:hypothetical protein